MLQWARIRSAVQDGLKGTGIEGSEPQGATELGDVVLDPV